MAVFYKNINLLSLYIFVNDRASISAVLALAHVANRVHLFPIPQLMKMCWWLEINHS